MRVHVNVNGNTVVATDDGFIGIFHKSKKEALMILNTLFATISLPWGIPGSLLAMHDLCLLTYYPKKWLLDIKLSTIQSERNMFSFMRDREGSYALWKVIERTAITTGQFRDNMVSFAYTVLSKHHALNRDLVLLFEGYTLLSKDSLNGAYLYGWMMIETFLDELWGEYIDSLNYNREERDSLKHHDKWTSHHQIEVFSLLNRLDLNSRNLLNRLRKTRNKIIHDRYNVSVNQTDECLGTAYRILRNRVRNPRDPLSNIT